MYVKLSLYQVKYMFNISLLYLVGMVSKMATKSKKIASGF